MSMATFPNLQLQQSQSQPQSHPQSKPFMNFVPLDPQFFSPASLPNPSPPSYVHVMGLAPARENDGWEPKKKRAKEQDFLEGSQISSIDFLQTGGSVVSTGLGLSLDDRRAGVSSGAPPAIPCSSIDEEIAREIQRQDVEMDRFLKLQGERLRQQILEKVQANQFQTLASLEQKFLQKIREKEAEVQDINRKNMELEEQMKQLSVEVAAWQHRAKYNETMITSLKLNLQQVYTQGKENHMEGYGDSEVEDTASCCNGGVGGAMGTGLQLLCKENKDMKELMTCKVCRTNEVCMLLLPCRHLCLCKECESKLSYCPLCHCSKLFGIEIYM